MNQNDKLTLNPNAIGIGNDRFRVRCHRPWTGFELFDHLGDVRPCCWGKHSCGNVNEAKPIDIWGGSGFQYYRLKMLQGDTEAICRPDCPILSGVYSEPVEQPYDIALRTSSPPRFLRVVPSISCDLKCPMCYQLDDPPPKLPSDFLTILDAWLVTAQELQVLGGEPFLSRHCLPWIEKVTPELYPNVGLAAITNGLHFSRQICDLILRRKWHWILVSIDAATASTYGTVRGGDFYLLRENLDRLAEARAEMSVPWELRFGFTLQNSNCHEASQFLRLCDDYRAVPQFTGVSGDWHEQYPHNWELCRNHLAAIETLDKALAMRGMSSVLIAPALSRVLSRVRSNRKTESFTPVQDLVMSSGSMTEQLIPAIEKARQTREVLRITCTGDSTLDLSVVPRPLLDEVTLISRALKNRDIGSERRCEFPIAFDNQCTFEDALSELRRRAIQIEAQGDRCEVVFHPNAIMRTMWGEIKQALMHLRGVWYSICIPFVQDGRSISALEWRGFVSELKNYAGGRGWRMLSRTEQVREFGLTTEMQCPEIIDRVARGECAAPEISVITAVYNGGDHLTSYLASISAQHGRPPMELVLVDDGSTDATWTIAQEWLHREKRIERVQLIRLSRAQPYKHGSFAFRAGVARQLACQFAESAQFLFLDADQVADSACVFHHAWLLSRGFDVVIGDRRHHVSRDSEWRAYTHRHAGAMESVLKNDNWWLMFYTGNSSVSRQAFERSGGFDKTLQYWGLDDTDLGYRLFRSGAVAWHSVRPLVHHAKEVKSGAGDDLNSRRRADRFHFEVLYRKYLDDRLINAYSHVLPI